MLDFAVVRETLRAGKATPAWLATWVPGAWADPEAFRKDFYAFAAAKREGAIKSRPQTGFDLYHDAVLAHVGRQKRALVAREREGGRELVTVSFESLHVRCSALADAWTREGVGPGTHIAVVLAPSVAMAVAILTAFRLGAVISYVPARGATYVKTRLAALAPERVATDEAGARFVGPLAEGALLPVTAPTTSVAGATRHMYLPGEPIARFVSPLLGQGVLPAELTADALHGALLRDALLVHALDGDDVVCAPGMPEAQHQPTAMLATLVAGATWVELELRDLDQDPKQLVKLGVTVLGASRALRERLITWSVSGALIHPAKRAVFTSLSDTLDLDRWNDLGRLLAKEALLTYGVVTSAAAGGTVLWNAPRTPTSTVSGLGVFPVPGETWQLSEVGAAGEPVPALGDSGIYTLLRDEEPALGVPPIVIAKFQDAYMLAGPLEPGPAGISYPTLEVAAVAEKHPAVRAASVFVGAGRHLNDARVVLLAFTDDLAAVASPPVTELRALVDREMGPGFTPDRIEVFALRPRFTEEGRVDHAWCRSQYLGGTLGRRSRSELFLTLSRLGWILGEAAEPT